jgi:hypothetical protein
MPDHDLVAAPFADRHVATTSFSIPISPIVVATISPIVIVATIVATITLTAVWSNAEVKLSKRDFGFGRDISGGCRENPHCARDGGDKRQFSHSNLLLR